jgi:hypothetical protein
MIGRMHYPPLFPLPVPDVIELLELPTEFGALPGSSPRVAQAVRTSAVLAEKRRQAMQVVEMDNPSTTTFALFL